MHNEIHSIIAWFYALNFNALLGKKFCVRKNFKKYKIKIEEKGIFGLFRNIYFLSKNKTTVLIKYNVILFLLSSHTLNPKVKQYSLLICSE